jgi:hypothetical protein
MMRVRILQRKFEDEWLADAYVYEDKDNNLIFRYNLTWESMGSKYAGKMKEAQVTLEEIETILPDGDRMRWLDIETIPDDQRETFLEQLDERCCIPRPQPNVVSVQ